MVKETLITATNAIPDSPEIQLAIGKIYFKDVAYTQALRSFEKADMLIKDYEGLIDQALKSEIAEHYGKTLHILGHTDEALSIFKIAYHDDPDHLRRR